MSVGSKKFNFHSCRFASLYTSNILWATNLFDHVESQKYCEKTPSLVSVLVTGFDPNLNSTAFGDTHNTL